MEYFLEGYEHLNPHGEKKIKIYKCTIRLL